MSLARWDPFADMAQLRDEVNRLFEHSITAGGREPVSTRMWAPTVDIEESENEIIIHAELPGINPDEIAIQMEGDTLTIRGERLVKKEEREKKYIRVERSYGSFQRSFSIGVPVKNDEVNAQYNEGVLTITLPKAEDIKPKQIPVKVTRELTDQK